MNPARQLGPAALGMSSRFLWIYPITPPFGAVVGGTAHTLLTHRLRGEATITWRGDSGPVQSNP